MRCPTCPLGPDRPCPAETRNDPRLCELADPAHPDHHPYWVAWLRGEAAALPAVSVRPSASAALAMIRRRDSCPFRRRKPGCPCVPGCGIPWLGDARGECPDATADACLSRFPRD